MARNVMRKGWVPIIKSRSQCGHAQLLKKCFISLYFCISFDMLGLSPMQTRQKVEQVKAYFSAVENLHNPFLEAVKNTKGSTLGGLIANERQQRKGNQFPLPFTSPRCTILILIPLHFPL